ncbi:hypothetical protein SOVF_137460 isoform B [Spinacia oleracea]|nr:hypothetical protein SOVF_137460 isoform B [Spinacia oleracea]
MVRSRIQIKKIENTAARQVTFSKRRKGLIKKAQELSTLCDAEIALIVFSSSTKLYEFSTSRVTRVIQKYMRHTGKVPDLVDSSNGIEPKYMLEEDIAIMSKEVDEKKQELSRMKGEDLEGLDIEELGKLERLVEKSYARVCRMKGNTLLENNKNLKHKISNATEVELHTTLEQQLAISPPTNVAFDTSLRLGLV